MTALVVPKVITLVRGMIEYLGGDDLHDLHFDVDGEELLRWKLPTQLCVPWTTAFWYATFGTAVVLATLTPALGMAVRSPLLLGARWGTRR